MQRLSAWLLSLWLGIQVGMTVVVSPILFTHLQVGRAVSTSLMNTFFSIANGLGILACLLLGVVCRPKVQWGRRSGGLKKSVNGLLVGLCVSCALINPAVAAYPQHFLVNWLGGSLGAWRGGLHVWNMILAAWGVILGLRLLRLEEQG